MAKNLFLIMVLAGFAACTGSSKKGESTDDLQLAQTGDFSLRIPGFLTPTKKLHDEASLQYQNLVREFYMIVIDESRTAFDSMITENEMKEYTTNLDGYAKLVKDQFADRVEDLDNIEIKTGQTSKGRDLRFFDANATVDGLKIYYHYGFVEDNKKYYQVISWTLQSKKDKYGPVMLDILKSFTVK